MSIEGHVGVHVDALELHPHAPPLPGRGRGQVVAVPADARRKEAAVSAHGVFGVHGALDAPVVGEGDGAPSGVIEGQGSGSGGVSDGELPVVVNPDVVAWTLGQRGTAEGKGRQQSR